MDDLLRCDWLGRIGLLLTRPVRHLAAHPFGSDRWLHRSRWVGWLVRYLDSSHNARMLVTYVHPFNDPLSGTTRANGYQKGKTNVDFTEAKDS